MSDIPNQPPKDESPAGQQPKLSKPALNNVKFHNLCGHNIKLLELQTKAVWRQCDKGSTENVAFTSQPIKPGQTIQISFLKKGYVNIGIRHSDPNDVNVVDRESLFTEILEKGYLCKNFQLMEDGDHMKVCYENVDERQEKDLEGNVNDSPDIWVFFEIVHGDVEVKLKIILEDKYKDMTFHIKHGEQIELSDERCVAYLKEGFLSAACIVEYPLSHEKTFQICANFLHDIHGFVFFRFGILTQPPDDIKNLSDLSKELRVEKKDAKASNIWFRETKIKRETCQGHFHLRWFKTGDLKHNITEDCSEETAIPQADPNKQAWLLLELFQMEVTVHIENAEQLQPSIISDTRDKEITNSRFVLIKGLKNTDNKENLKMLLEIALNNQNPVDKIVYGSRSDKVVVTFTNQVHPKFLETFVEKRGHRYKFETIKEPTVVQVLDIPKGTEYLLAVKLYLKNERKSGGTNGADFYGTPNPNCGYCLIDLKDPKVVNRVCNKEHNIAEKKIRILPYYGHLGIAVNLEDRPTDLISDELILKEIDKHMLQFILKKMEKEFGEFQKAQGIRKVDQSINSMTFSPNLDESSSTSVVVIGPEWKIRVENAFNTEFRHQLCVESIEIKDERKWKHLQAKKEDLCRGTPVVSLYEDQCPSTFKFVSRKSDETILKTLKDKFESEKPPEESVTDNYNESNLKKLRAFMVLGFKEEIESKTKVELRINVDDGNIELFGLKENNQLAKTEIARKIASLEDKTCPPPNEDYIIILKSPQLTEQANREIEKKNLRGTWEIVSDGLNQQICICYEESQKSTFNEIKDLIFGLLETYIIVVDDKMEKESLKGLRTEIEHIEDSLEPFAQIRLVEDSKHVRITCRKDLMVECKQKVEDFIKVHIICTSEVPIKQAIADYMNEAMKSQIQQDLQNAGVNSLDLKFSDNKFYITGNQNVLSTCTKVLHKLASKVIVTWRPIERKGIHKYFTGDAGKNMESEVTNCHLKVHGKDDFQKQKIRAIALTKEGQALSMGVLDLYKQPVDAIVNENFEQFNKGGKAVEREIAHYIETKGNLTEGEVFVTGSGKLPCLKILHAVAPKWRGGTANEDKTLEKTIEEILFKAESESLRSIAMPVVACRSVSGYPFRRASGIILQTIIKQWPTRFKSIREIYICDTDDIKLQTFKRLAENMFISQCFSIPLGQNQTFGKTLAQHPKRNLRDGWQTIVQRRGIRKIPLPDGREIIIAWGDLARLSDCTPPLKADIIVNPTTSFPDLRGVIANSLKAAANNGGQFDLESECKKNVPQGGLNTGYCVATATPYMPCDEILHLKIEDDWGKINEETLKGYIKTCVNYALLNDKTSIAFPTIGTGSKGYPRDVVARCFAHAISEFSQAQRSGSLKKVIIVIYHRDSETTEAFDNELHGLLAKRPHRLVAKIEEELMEEEHIVKEKKGTVKTSYSDNPLPASPIPLGTYPLQNGCSLTLKHGSLEHSGAEALVSPTSGIPILNGQIPSAIRKAAGGTSIEDELQKNYGKGIRVGVGDIAVTSAGNIRGCNKVYHLKLENYNSQSGSQASLIYNSVNTCLKQADKDGLSSVAFPTLGTGGFNWPSQLVADETFQAVKSYTNSRQSSRPPLYIIITIFDQNSPENMVFQTTAKNQLSQGGTFQNKLGPVATPDGDQSSVAMYSNIKIELLPGQLEESKTDVIVNTTPSFPILNGAISKALVKVAGPSLQADCTKNYPQGLQDGQIASTSGGNLNCKNVFHIKLSEWNHINGKSIVEGAVTECLNMLQSAGFHSIAFPTIGMGGFKYPAKDVASAMFEAAKQFSQTNPGYHVEVTIVMFHLTKDANQVFKDSLSQTFHDVQKGVAVKKKGVRIADNDDKKEAVLNEKETYVDHEKRDFILLKFISDNVDKANKAFKIVKTKVDHDFSGHEPLKNDVIGKMSLSDIQEIEMICKKLDVEVEVSTQTNEINFEGTAGNVRNANEQILKLLTTLHVCLQNETVGKLVQQYYEWCYEETKHILIPYPKRIGIELEIAFAKGDKTYEFTDTDDLKYCVDFSKYEESEVSRKSNRVKVVRLDRMMGDLQPMPHLWNEKDTTILEVVPLQNSNLEYWTVEADFKCTLGSYQFKMIHGIKRIQNRTIYQQYALKRSLMQRSQQQLQQNNQPIEMTLWHGTTLEKVDTINLNGFNRSYAYRTNDDSAKYGKGVYFSKQSENECNDNYTVRDTKGHKHMYQCKVLTGNCKDLTQEYKERYPPTDPATGIKYDSTLSPNKVEYVIYSDTQSYPEYLIEFE